MTYIEEDIKYVSNVAKKLGLNNKTFLVTGATGMIGKSFIGALRKITSDKKIYVFGFDLDDVTNAYGTLNVNLCSFHNIEKLKENIDFIIHLASPTSPKTLNEKPVETISFIYESTKQILELGRRCGSKILFISSMEVYGEVLDGNVRQEADLGYVDLKKTRSSYPEAKRLCELLCFSYSQEYQLNVCCARLSQTFGAGTNLNDPRIFGYLARCVLNNDDIKKEVLGVFASEIYRSFRANEEVS